MTTTKHGSTTTSKTPGDGLAAERRLLSAMVCRAALDYLYPIYRRRHQAGARSFAEHKHVFGAVPSLVEHRTACWWIFTSGAAGAEPWTFPWACDHLGLSPSAVRAAVRAAADGPSDRLRAVILYLTGLARDGRATRRDRPPAGA